MADGLERVALVQPTLCRFAGQIVRHAACPNTTAQPDTYGCTIEGVSQRSTSPTYLIADYRRANFGVYLNGTWWDTRS